MSVWDFRLAEPADAEAFAKWASQNPQIDPQDLKAGMYKTNPTVLTFVATKDGVPIVFSPIYLSAVLAHLGINPEAGGKDIIHALGVLRDGAMGFFVQYGIREITTLSKPDYVVAQWALAHDFSQEPRNLFRLDLNEQMSEAI